MYRKKLGVVLYCGRKDCVFSKKIKKFIKRYSNKFYYLESNKIGEKVPRKFYRYKYDYIFCFRSFYIITKKLLKKVRKAPINFHPSPPEFRGAGGINYTLYKRLNFFGSTAHLMSEKIDYGKILDVRKFKINNKESIEKILNKTYKISTKQIYFIINELLKNQNSLSMLIKKNKHMKWSRKFNTIKDLNKFYEINIKVSKSEFLKKIRSTNTIKFKPFITLHGHKFLLE